MNRRLIRGLLQVTKPSKLFKRANDNDDDDDDDDVSTRNEENDDDDDDNNMATTVISKFDKGKEMLDSVSQKMKSNFYKFNKINHFMFKIELILFKSSTMGHCSHSFHDSINHSLLDLFILSKSIS
jgi:hypothetical protein